MKFEKGHKRVGGRKKGSQNHKTKQWDTFSKYCVEGGLTKFETELNKLKGKDYVNAFLQLLEYHKPKLNRTTLSNDPDNPFESELSDEQLSKYIKSILNGQTKRTAKAST